MLQACYSEVQLTTLATVSLLRDEHLSLEPRGGSYLSYSKILASKTVSLFTYSQKMGWKFWSKWSRLNKSAWLQQSAMSSGTNLAWKAQRGLPFVLLTVPQKKLARSRFVGSEHRSCVIFCFDIHS